MKKRRGPLYWLATRSRRFWIVWSFVLLYFAAIGPLTWLHANGFFPRWLRPVLLIYYPIDFACRYGPYWFRDAMIWYSEFWGWVR